MKRGIWLPLLFLALGLAAIGGFAGAAWALSGDGGGPKEGTSAVERTVPRRAPADEGEFGRGPGPGDGTERAFLGVVLADGPDGEGAMVVRVTARSPAQRAGFKARDIIVAVDGNRVDEADEVVEIVGDAEPGDELTFRVRRRGDDRELRVTLGERPSGLGELMPPVPREVGPPEGRAPRELRPGLSMLQPFQAMLLGRLLEGHEDVLERFVRAELVYLNDEGEIETVRAVAGTVESVDGDELVLAAKDGGAERFGVSEETQVWRLFARAELDDLEEGDRVVVIVREGDEAAAIVILGAVLLPETS